MYIHVGIMTYLSLSLSIYIYICTFESYIFRWKFVASCHEGLPTKAGLLPRGEPPNATCL